MIAQLTHTQVAEHTAVEEAILPGGATVAITLTVRLETPGECCADIASTLAFGYAPPLPDDIAVRLDDRLYDGLYDGLADAPGALPPGKLAVAITALASEPPPAALVAGNDWALIGALGDALAGAARSAVLAAWDGLQRQLS